jgi:hypothetical protein
LFIYPLVGIDQRQLSVVKWVWLMALSLFNRTPPAQTNEGNTMKRRRYWIGLVALLATIGLMLALARLTRAASAPDGTLCGMLTGATTLTPAASPYAVTCGVAVAAGVSLTTPPGVTLPFEMQGASANRS